MDFIQQAYKGKNDWWRYLVTLSVLFLPFIMNFVFYIIFPEYLDSLYERMENFQGDKNRLLFESLAPFVILLLLLFLFVKFLHKRSVTSLITSRHKVNWKKVLFAFGLWLLISVIFLSIGVFLAPENFIWNFKPVPFITLIFISLLVMPLQTSMEELLFRGYLMQGLGILVKNRFVPLILTSVVFGLMHGFNPEVEKLGYGIMIFYIGTGLFFGITTLMDEGTELALGLHAANNIVAAVFITSNWMVFQTDALYIDISEPTLGLQAYFPVFVLYPLMLLLFSKKYNWHNWREKLTGKVVKPRLIAGNE